jgi:hypothetical protein
MREKLKFLIQTKLKIKTNLGGGKSGARPFLAIVATHFVA